MLAASNYGDGLNEARHYSLSFWKAQVYFLKIAACRTRRYTLPYLRSLYGYDMSKLTTAKVFTTGNSQAVRLPKAFRLEVNEAWITRNEITGEIQLQPKTRPEELKTFFALLAAAPLNSDEFLMPRADAPKNHPWEQ
jgi:antitoxin VapB